MSDDILKQRILAARFWLAGYIDTSRKMPSLMYHKKANGEPWRDAEGRLALAQLLVNGEAPREILELLAHAITPDDPQNSVRGTPVFNEHLPSTVLSEMPINRRLDFVHRGGGSRKRGVGRSADPVRDGYIISEVQALIINGCKKTNAFQKVAEQAGLSAQAVRKIWKKYPDFIAFWEADRKKAICNGIKVLIQHGTE